MTFSISAELDAGGDKSYLRHLATHGYEMGVGRKGVYDAHAHLGFTDLAYAPGGLLIHQPDAVLEGLVHLTAPGSWFGPIEFLSDFWFIKFFQSAADERPVPDKVTDRAAVGFEGCLVADRLDAVLPFWHPREGSRRIRLALGPDDLRVEGLDAVDSRLTVAG